jgi:hypothetical protein
MTTNERLFVAGLLYSFEDAIDQGDRTGAIEVLRQVEFGTTQAGQVVDTILRTRASTAFRARRRANLAVGDVADDTLSA